MGELKKLREQAGMTIPEAAAAVDMDEHYLIHIEQGAHTPTKNLVARLTEVYSEQIKRQPALDVVEDLKARLLPIFTRYNALSGEPGDVPLHILRMIAEQDGDIDVVECRDNVGMLGQVIITVVRLIVAEERIDRAERRAEAGDQS